MKTKWSLTVLSLFSLSIAACSSGTENQGNLPQPAILPPVVRPTPTQPAILPPIVRPTPTQPSPDPSSKPTPITAKKTAEVLVNDLNVRSSPSANSQSRGTVSKGTQAKIIQSQGSWYYIVMGPIEGWVAGSYIKVLDGSPGNVATKPTPVTEAKTAEVQVNVLSVRSSPNNTSQIRGTLPKRAQAKIIQLQGDWYYIVMGRVEGWVEGSYVKVLDGNPGSAK